MFRTIFYKKKEQQENYPTALYVPFEKKMIRM